MDRQPAKRRKTSPTKSTPVLALSSPRRPGSSRASFMTPTRASLSRFNPALLPQPRSANAATVRRSNGATSFPSVPPAPSGTEASDQYMARGQQALDFIMSNFGATVQNALAARQGQADMQTSMLPSLLAQEKPVPVVPTGLETDEQMEAMRAAIRARKETERSVGSRESPTTSFENGNRSQPEDKDSLSVSQQQDENEVDDDDDEDEDELSMEMSNSDNLQTTPLAQIRDKISEREKDATSRRVSLPTVEHIDELDELSPDVSTVNHSAQRPTLEPDDLPETPDNFRKQLEIENQPPRGVLYSSPSRRRRMRPGPHLVRSPLKENVDTFISRKSSNLVPADARERLLTATSSRMTSSQIIVRRNEKVMLDKELRSLRAEVRDLEDYANTYLSSTSIDDKEAKNFLGLINLINLTREQKETHDLKPTLFSLLGSYLPFPVPRGADSSSSRSTEQENHFVTHDALVEKDPLPLGSLFTPLAITAVTRLPKSEAGSIQLLQRHSILLQSPGSMLSCVVDCDIATEPTMTDAPTIEALQFSKLSSWAHPEISSWLNDRCNDGDIAAVGYALGRYWDISLKRAECWMQCQNAFPVLFQQSTEQNAKPFTISESNLESGSTTVPKRDLLPLLGKDFLIFRGHDVVLTISWKLQFDWTGEVESVVSAEAALPQAWHEADTINVLRKIPTMFDALMRDRGIVQAVRVIAGLLFSVETR